MATFLALGKYTAAGAAGVLSDGVASRRPISEKVVEAGGGKLLGWYAVADGEWHIAMLIERPDDQNHAASDAFTALFSASTGSYESWKFMRLVSGEEVDEWARKDPSLAAFRKPGEASN